MAEARIARHRARLAPTSRSGSLGMALVCVWAAPFVWMVSTSLKPPAQVMTRTIEWLPREVTLRQLPQGAELPDRAPGR